MSKSRREHLIVKVSVITGCDAFLIIIRNLSIGVLFNFDPRLHLFVTLHLHLPRTVFLVLNLF